MDEQEHEANPVDLHVGSRIRLCRQLIGMSQEKLGEAVGVTFQQIQKYERGANRVGASRLYQIAQALSVSISSFFEGLSSTGQNDASHARVTAFLSSSEGADLAAAWVEVPRPAVRRRLLELVRSLRNDEEQ